MNAFDLYMMPIEMGPGARETRAEGASLPDWYIRQVLGNPKAGDHAQRNAQQSAIWLEADRETYRDTR